LIAIVKLFSRSVRLPAFFKFSTAAVLIFISSKSFDYSSKVEAYSFAAGERIGPI
jgi:hypothetical protein